MAKDESTRTREIQIKLTDEQRAEIVRFIHETRNANLDVDVVFEADLEKAAVAPVSVLVGNAI